MQRRATLEQARPLRADQHVVFPDSAVQHALENLVHVLGRIRLRRFANDLALELGVLKFQLQSGIGLPKLSRRRRVHLRAVILTIDVERRWPAAEKQTTAVIITLTMIGFSIFMFI